MINDSVSTGLDGLFASLFYERILFSYGRIVCEQNWFLIINITPFNGRKKSKVLEYWLLHAWLSNRLIEIRTVLFSFTWSVVYKYKTNKTL